MKIIIPCDMHIGTSLIVCMSGRRGGGGGVGGGRVGDETRPNETEHYNICHAYPLPYHMHDTNE